MMVAKMSLWWSMGFGSSSGTAPFNGQTDTSHASMFLEYCKAKPNFPRFGNLPLPTSCSRTIPTVVKNQHSVRFMAGRVTCPSAVFKDIPFRFIKCAE